MHGWVLSVGWLLKIGRLKTKLQTYQHLKIRFQMFQKNNCDVQLESRVAGKDILIQINHSKLISPSISLFLSRFLSVSLQGLENCFLTPHVKCQMLIFCQ